MNLRPPRLAARWLESRLYPDERDELMGDLAEQFADRVEARGRGAAVRWYWRQALALGWGFFLHRRDLMSNVHERTRGRWLLEGLATDVRHAWRSLRHSPTYALVALSTLTVGIGLTTAVFSLVNGVLLRPLPYPDADRLVRVGQYLPEETTRVGRPDPGSLLRDVTIGVWDARLGSTSSVDALVPFSTSASNVASGSATELVTVASVGGRFFELLAAVPVSGRLLGPGDDAADGPPVAVVSLAFAERYLDGPERAAGRSVQIEGDVHTVVGVTEAPAFPDPAVEVWVPGRWAWPDPGGRRMFSLSLDVLARMRPDATIDDVRRDAAAVLDAVASADAAGLGTDVPVPVARVMPLLDSMVAPVRPALMTLLAGMVLVLAAACVNLANLVLARNTSRTRDLAVRRALGASRSRLTRPLFLEQLMLAGAGSTLGGALAWWLLRGLPVLAPAGWPRLADVEFDLASLAFATLAAFATAVVVGTLPAWQSSGGTLRDASHLGRTRLLNRAVPADRIRGVLVSAQVALAVALLVGATLLGRTFVSLMAVDPGYEPDRVLTFQVSLPEGIWSETGRQTAYFDELLGRLQATPGVEAAAVASGLPLHLSGFSGTYLIDGQPTSEDPADRPSARNVAVTAGFLDLMGIDVVRGRAFTEADGADAEPVVLIDEVSAARYFPGEDPIGRHIRSMGNKLYRIIGITEAVQMSAPPAEPDTVVLFAAPQLAEILAFNKYGGGVAVRTAGDPAAMAATIERVAREVDAGIPVHNLMPLGDRASEAFGQARFYAAALGLFAALALSTAMLGVYGVLAYAVERRRLEFGVRRALGAETRHVVGLVVRRVTVMAAAGLGVGLVLAASGVGLMRSMLFGVEPLDRASFAAVAIAVLLVVALATLAPIRRALSIEPARALRLD